MSSGGDLVSTQAADRPGIFLTREQLEAWATRPLTDEQIEQMEIAIPNSSIPDAIVAISDSLHNGEEDDDE